MAMRRTMNSGSSFTEVGGWLASGILIACGGGYWAGLRSIEAETAAPHAVEARVGRIAALHGNAGATVPAGIPRPLAAGAAATEGHAPASARPATPAGEAERAIAPGAVAAPGERAQSGPDTAAVAPPRKPAVVPPAPAAAAQPQAPGPGAVARLAAFGDARSARSVWRDMERVYPRLRQQPAAIIQNRDSSGRLFYQFEVAAPSLAEARLLCASMERSNYRCDAAAR